MFKLSTTDSGDLSVELNGKLVLPSNTTYDQLCNSLLRGLHRAISFSPVSGSLKVVSSSPPFRSQNWLMMSNAIGSSSIAIQVSFFIVVEC